MHKRTSTLPIVNKNINLEAPVNESFEDKSAWVVGEIPPLSGILIYNLRRLNKVIIKLPGMFINKILY